MVGRDGPASGWIFQSQAGTPFVTKQQFATSQGWDSSCYAPPLATLDWEFVPHFAAINASWVGAVAYSPVTGTRPGQWIKGSGGAKQYLSGVGAGDFCSLGSPSLPRVEKIELLGWCDTGFGVSNTFSVLNATWEGEEGYWPSSGLLGGSWAQGTFLATLTARGFDAERFQGSRRYSTEISM